MDHTYTVRCSDCGSLALRTHSISTSKETSGYSETIKTECPSCDYLLITGSTSGNVIDAHSSTASIIARKQSLKKSDSAIYIKTKTTLPWSAKIPA